MNKLNTGKVAIIGATLVILVTSMLFTSVSANGSINILQDSMEHNENSVWVSGLAQNTGNEDKIWVTIKVHFYDSEDILLATESDTVNDIPAGAKFRFNVTLKIYCYSAKKKQQNCYQE